MFLVLKRFKYLFVFQKRKMKEKEVVKKVHPVKSSLKINNKKYLQFHIKIPKRIVDEKGITEKDCFIFKIEYKNNKPVLNINFIKENNKKKT